MPLYEYQCKQCHQRLEKIQSFSAPLETVCPKCGGALEKLISAPAIQFKGAGWYVNDYAKSGKKTAPSGDAESASDGKGDKATGSETKSETKSESKDTNKGANSSSASDTSSSSAAPASSSAAPVSSSSGSSSKSD